MASSRRAGSIGLMAVGNPDRLSRSGGPGGGIFASPHVLGYYVDRRSRRQRRGKKGSGTMEITVAADFPNPWASSAEEIRAIDSDRWFPSTDDFIAVEHNGRGDHTRTATPITGSVEAFIHHILDQPRGSIKRLNILTHGSAASIALSGTIDKEGAVFFDEEMDIGTLRSLLLHGIEYRGRRVEWKEVEEHFGDDAEIVVYACKAALSETLLQDMANFFGVTVKGFTRELFYFHNTSGSKTALKRGGITVDGQRDFHDLVPTVVKREELKDPFK